MKPSKRLTRAGSRMGIKHCEVIGVTVDLLIGEDGVSHVCH
jgi:hypothetical protein